MSTIPIQSSSGSVTMYTPDRNGDDYLNTGREQLVIYNNRSVGDGDTIVDVKVKVRGTGKCSMGLKHDFEQLVTGGAVYTFVAPLDRHRVNDSNGKANVQFLNPANDAILENGDGSGHPNRLGIAIVRLYDEV